MMFRHAVKRFPLAVEGYRLLTRIIAASRGGKRRAYAVGLISRIQKSSGDPRSRFVGYYDHSAFNVSDENVLLVHSTAHASWRRPSPRIPVSIELFDWKEGKVQAELGQSYCWNWQQGARALWLDKTRVIFNVYDEAADCYRSEIVCSATGQKSELAIPVQEIDREGRVYGLSYEALALIRPDYGYRNRRVALRSLFDNGIDQYDPGTGYVRRILNIASLVDEAAFRHGIQPTRGKLNHIMASPDCGTIVFLFRYFLGDQRVTDLYSYDLEQNHHRLELADLGLSHACWWDSQTLVATLNGPEGFGYYFVHVGTDKRPSLICQRNDGHPSRINEEFLLTDSYPDKFGLRRLMALGIHSRQFVEIASSPEPLLFQGETRCDLHPSLSPSGRWIQFDCAVGHRRSVAVIKNPMLKDT